MLFPMHRQHARAYRLAAAVAVISITTLFYICRGPNDLYLPGGGMPRNKVLVPPRRLPLILGAVREVHGVMPSRQPPEAVTDAALLPGWEVLALLQKNASLLAKDAVCAFHGGASSPARALGRLPASGRQVYTCVMPERERRHLPFRAPLVVSSSEVLAGGSGGSPEMIRWSGQLVYDAVSVHGGDVLVFAKGVNPRHGVNRAAADVRCMYYRSTADNIVAAVPATTSAQEVFRCPPPPMSAGPTLPEIRVTLSVADEEPIPSLATYRATRGSSAVAQDSRRRGKKLICACTMVRDVAKFLREWVGYHAAVGVDRFYIYDNGSEDDLVDQVHQLIAAGVDISRRVWPWPKTQEAGFSHCAAVHQDSCEWMAFVDVDEFIFSPLWIQSSKPNQSMLHSIVSVSQDVGQVSLGCVEFGPSGQTTHPKEGVTQGYTCRRRVEERHKSLVRLNALDKSLINSIHHFGLRDGFRTKRVKWARVNHYKYQAWDEFKVKFRRRVSTYVIDWTNRVNLGSRDRAPGLGFEAVEPVDWAQKFCEVKDTQLRDITRRWFHVSDRSKLISA